jgi:DNA-binding NtrC family response regulator
MDTKKVLIIDDESLIREALKICLHDLAGWDVLARISHKRLTKKLKSKTNGMIP